MYRDGNEDELHLAVARAIQTNQHEAMVVSPVALVAAVILFGRSSGSVTMGKLALCNVVQLCMCTHIIYLRYHL